MGQVHPHLPFTLGRIIMPDSRQTAGRSRWPRWSSIDLGEAKVPQGICPPPRMAVAPIADQLAALGVPFLFATGHGEDGERGVHGAAPVLGKPFDPDALVADMSHFGRRAIRVDWFALVTPALMLNHLDQAALMLENPTAAADPLMALFPGRLLYPAVALATAAAVRRSCLNVRVSSDRPPTTSLAASAAGCITSNSDEPEPPPG
ncbi:KUP/HAK/KT family potassium transporter [Dankookia rubra]|nr:KUP/HAK/KT family potassium transporter [Dankookia rubra]